ncbi:MAG TPA: YetF domain-containing protein [Phycisphaerales bacterium]|nr:YetF domain-containing protein [Phycisphaerales bacterium]
MDMIVRGAGIYAVVWLCFRLAGRRTMAEMTTFDFVLLLICGEATQQALLGDDFSLTNAAILVLTLVSMDGALTALRVRFHGLERVMEGLPLVLIRDGKMLHDRMAKERIDQEDILHEARSAHGLERLEDIKHAVLEPSGGISIIPRRAATS